MNASNQLVAISLAQWREWLSQLRLAVMPERIVLVEGPGDDIGFSCLVGRSQAGLPEAASLVLARLRPGYRLPLPSPAGLVDVDISAVLEFVPLSADGRIMLESDAAQMGVRLGNPEYEQLWRSWERRYRTAADDAYGMTLASLFRLPEPRIHQISELERSWLDWDPSRAGNDKRSAYEGSQGLCWFDALSRLGEKIGKDAKKDLSDRHALPEFLRRRQAAHDLSASCIETADAIGLGRALRRDLLERTREDLSILQLVVVSHYRYLLLSDRKTHFESLHTDLSVLAREEGKRIAALAAYFIGRHMPTGMVASLRFATTPERFAFLDGSDRHPLRPVEASPPAELPLKPIESADTSDTISKTPPESSATQSSPELTEAPASPEPVASPSSRESRRSRRK